MDYFAGPALAQALDYPSLIDALADTFRADTVAPRRHHHAMQRPSGAEDSLLLMPAWNERFVGVKVVAVLPGNGARGLPAVGATYVLMDAESGRGLAVMDGAELTARRTAAASALASRYLSRPDSHHLLMVGTGALAPHLIGAHASQRPITRVTVWGRDPRKAQAVAAGLAGAPFAITAASGLQAACREADIISCATLAAAPLVLGAWLSPGQHLDLVGAFRPDMREVDDAAVTRAEVFVDTRDGALTESGDLLQPMKAGVFAPEDVRADLFDLCRGRHVGRTVTDSITLFESTGAALEDLAAATLAFARLSG